MYSTPTRGVLPKVMMMTAGSAQQHETTSATQPSHMTPCVCHCAACRAAGHGNGACVLLCAGLHDLFDGKADVVDLVLRHYYGACGWDTAHFDTAVQCVSYGPACDMIAVGCMDDGRIHLICAHTGENILCPQREDEVRTLPKGIRSDFELCLEKKLEQHHHQEHADSVSSVHFSPDGTQLVTGSWDYTVKIWDPSTGACLSTLMGHEAEVWGVSFDPEGKILASCSFDKTVRLWDASTRAPVGSPLNVGGEITSVAFSMDGSKISIAFSVRKHKGKLQEAGVKIFSNEGSAGFVYQSTLKGHSKNNTECTCTHGRCLFDDYRANPHCPVRGHKRYFVMIF